MASGVLTHLGPSGEARMVDVSDKADQAAKDADVAGRRKQFEAALGNMKRIAEAG